jgi:hypothetical protein
LALVGGDTQVSPSQQPPQFAGPQVVALTHFPPKQVWAPGQATQAPPSMPQAVAALPSWQLVSLATQPGQV